METEHPYNFVASQGARELLEAEGASDKTIPIVQKLILPLRAGLTSRDVKTWNNAMDLFKLMCEVTGEHIVPHAHLILASLNSKLSNKNYREKVMEILMTLQNCGGPDAVKLIKQKVPTYNSMQ